MSGPRTLLRNHGGVLLCVLATLVCVGAAAVLYARHPPSLLETANKLGPAAENLVHGRGLAICYGTANQPDCFYAQRMPVAPVTLAFLYLLFGEHGTVAALVKTLFCLAPVLMLFACIMRHAQFCSARRRVAVFALLLLAIFLPPTLDLSANLNFEEAYFYGWFALATGLLFFPELSVRRPRLWVAVVCLGAVFCYLTKSSLLLAASFLVAAAAFYTARCLRRTRLAIALICAFASAPLLWGAWQHHASGRFTLGTSLDGVNLYKGNNPLFLGHYPAFRGASVDLDEAALFAGHVSETEEWDENDFGLASARAYVRTHPTQTLEAVLRKASVFFLGVERNAADEAYNAVLELAFTAGLVLFRIMLLAAIALALRQFFSRSADRFPTVVFLGTVACIAAPYIAGFALTRHATVLILPAAAYLCRLLLHEPSGCFAQQA